LLEVLPEPKKFKKFRRTFHKKAILETLKKKAGHGRTEKQTGNLCVPLTRMEKTKQQRARVKEYGEP